MVTVQGPRKDAPTVPNDSDVHQPQKQRHFGTSSLNHCDAKLPQEQYAGTALTDYAIRAAFR